jgi:site-specific DNA recombinase
LWQVSGSGGGLESDTVNRQQAEQVREIFDLYIQHEAPLPVVWECCSRGWTTKVWINRRGERKGGLLLNKARIYNIITTPLYMGKVKAGELVLDGEQDAIIDKATFAQVRTILDRNNRNGVKACLSRAHAAC